MTLSIIEQVVERMDGMPQSLQQQVLRFTEMLEQTKTKGETELNILKLAGTIPVDNLALMEKAVEEDSGRGNVKRHFGTLKLTAPPSLDNDSIDADLANEYSDDHEVL